MRVLLKRNAFFKRLFFGSALIIAAAGFLVAADVSAQVRATNSFDNDWLFFQGDAQNAANANFNDAGWRKLNVPHDWSIEGAFDAKNLTGGAGGFLPAGVGWYRKHFAVSPNDKGKQIYLDIDGAMSHATVWLNGKFVGGWNYGYSSFRLDLTAYLETGAENVLAIRLENPPESSRWYPGAGIYRNVWLVKTAPVHVAHWGTYVTTPKIDENAATVNVKTTIENDSAATANVTIKTSIYELGANDKKSKKPVAVSEKANLNLTQNTNQTAETNLRVAKPKLWKLQTPNRYVAVTEIEQNGKTIDVDENVFGIRTIKFDAEKGFLLNGERVYIKGVCNHHDLGALGTAINVRAGTARTRR